MFTTLGIIGAGHRAQALSEILLKNHPEYRLVAVYDSYYPLILKLRNENPTSSIAYTNSYPEFFATKPMVVMVAPINSEHYEALQECLRHGVHIFCEKPIVATLGEMKLFQGPEITAYPKLLMSGLVLRHSPFYQKIKSLLPQIGKVKSMLVTDHLHYGHGAFIITNWRRDKKFSGGHINEKSIHMIDLIQWWLDQGTPTEIKAMGARSFWKPANRTDGDKLIQAHQNSKLFSQYVVHNKLDPYSGDGDIEDNITAVMRFKDDIVVTLHAVTHCPDSRRLFLITGTCGEIEAEWRHNTGTIQVTYAGTRGSAPGPGETLIFKYPKMGCHGNGDDNIMASLVTNVVRGTRMDPSFTAALNATETALRIEEILLPQMELEKSEDEEM